MVNTCVSNIIPKDARIYYENGVPYMEYKGVTYDWRNDKVEVYFPKISLNISEVEYSEDISGYEKLNVTFSGEGFKLKKPVFTTIERTMTKADIEKELGYKINIVEK